MQQDEVYETIYQELQKKLPYRNPQTPPPPLLMVPDHEQQKPLSPHLFNLEGDDDVFDNDSSVNDDVSSSASSDNNVSPSQDGYDTDIESGKFIISIKNFIENLLFLFNRNCY